MFNLNENNRIQMSRHPSDMRIGLNGMCGQVRSVGLEPTNGDVYILGSMLICVGEILRYNLSY